MPATVLTPANTPSPTPPPCPSPRRGSSPARKRPPSPSQKPSLRRSPATPPLQRFLSSLDSWYPPAPPTLLNRNRGKPNKSMIQSAPTASSEFTNPQFAIKPPIRGKPSHYPASFNTIAYERIVQPWIQQAQPLTPFL